jgi:hypothetical protein
MHDIDGADDVNDYNVVADSDYGNTKDMVPLTYSDFTEAH